MPTHNVITPTDISPQPSQSEQYVARLIAEYFQSNVQFVKPRIQRAPDLYVIKTRQNWEIKNIQGNSKRTIANNLRNAKYQSPNIIISLQHTKMTTVQAVSRVKEYLKSGPTNIKHIIIISKSSKVIAIR